MSESRKHWIAVAAVAATLLAANWSCKKKQAQEANAPPLSEIDMGSPHAPRQLIDGFWGVENKSWRWTRHNFSVLLEPPFGATTRGAMLAFRFTVPDSVISRRKSLKLMASVETVVLPAETYTESGSYIYKAQVPAAAFPPKGPVKVTFSTDNYLAAGEVEGRELALIAHSIALTPQ